MTVEPAPGSDTPCVKRRVRRPFILAKIKNLLLFRNLVCSHPLSLSLCQCILWLSLFDFTLCRKKKIDSVVLLSCVASGVNRQIACRWNLIASLLGHCVQNQDVLQLKLQLMKARMRFEEKSFNAMFYFHIRYTVLADRHAFLIFFTLLFCCQRLYKMSGEDSAIDYEAIITELQSIQPINVSENTTKPIQHEIRMIYLITYSVVLILGVTLNFIVIVISCLTNKKSPMVAIWIMALALTHLVSSAFTVFQLLYAYDDFEWNYGKATCKLSSYITYSSMFSTAAMLSFWSISFAFSKSECFKNCKNCNIILISFSWTIAAVLACPSLFSREVRSSQCIDDYDLDKSKTTQGGISRLKSVIIMRFLFGLLVPALIMFLSCLTSAHRTCKDCKKQAQIICAIKIVFFVFWGPQIFLTMLQATLNHSLGPSMLKYGLPAATALATAHSFTSPIIYLLLGCNIKMKWMAHDPGQCEMRDYNTVAWHR